MNQTIKSLIIIALLWTAASDNLPAAQRWVAEEFVFTSAGSYSDRDAFYKVRVDVDFTSQQGTKLIVPAFWDGGQTWRVRFAPTETGNWSYVTRCNIPEDSGLNQQKGAFHCNEYSGTLDIYRHGFVTTRDGLKYLIYADGTPFFYLGDTHWGMLTEEFDSPGPNAGNTKATSHFCYIVNRRASQGFTVYQSEPIGTSVKYADGISAQDIAGFQEMDRYFKYIASQGLVHANSQFFYPSEMKAIENDDSFLELISRYWVARYGAYPVLWTLGQEVDNDFYEKLPLENNPYVKICRWMYQYDAYRHPISAHQENVGATTRTGVGNSKPSRFQNVQEHTWYAVQWSQYLTSNPNREIPQDYWNNGTGKPAILYEGRYCHLWTKDFGARLQGWMAFLNGMYGYGYGAIDIWLYNSKYDANTTSSDGIDKITPEDKAIPWSTSVEFPSAYQVGYMKKSLGLVDWWKLVPEFAGQPFFKPDSEKVFYFAAHADVDVFVLYFYSQNCETGSLTGLNPAYRYNLSWFNPRTGDKREISPDIQPNPDGTIVVENRPDAQDWVLFAKRNL